MRVHTKAYLTVHLFMIWVCEYMCTWYVHACVFMCVHAHAYIGTCTSKVSLTVWYRPQYIPCYIQGYVCPYIHRYMYAYIRWYIAWYIVV